MPRWNCSAVVAGSKFLGIVEADTKEEAINLAWALETADDLNFCWQCSDNCEDPMIQEITAHKESD